MTTQDSGAVIELLQRRLHSLNDLAFSLRHLHWNVVDRTSFAVHEMLDPQVEQVRSMTDDLAERISTLGGEPQGTPGALASDRTWDGYSIGRARALEHPGALDLVYTSVIEDYRAAMKATDEPGPVTQDMLIDQLRALHWSCSDGSCAPTSKAAAGG